ncbi:hypothetical protein ABHI18_000644 [Aspergillus niger]
MPYTLLIFFDSAVSKSFISQKNMYPTRKLILNIADPEEDKQYHILYPSSPATRQRPLRAFRIFESSLFKEIEEP